MSLYPSVHGLVFLVATSLVTSVALAENGNGISAESAQRIYQRVDHDFPKDSGCTFDGVNTEGDHLELQWSSGGKSQPPFVVTLRSAPRKELTLTSAPSDFTARCLGGAKLIESLHAVIAAENRAFPAETHEVRPPPSPEHQSSSPETHDEHLPPRPQPPTVATNHIPWRGGLVAAVVTLLALVLLAALWTLLRRARRSRPTRSDSRPWLECLAAVGLTLFAYFMLNRANPHLPVVDYEPTRDLQLVRDCVELGRCHTRGPGSSARGLTQGGVWLQLLAMVEWLGGATPQIRNVIVAIQAVGAGVLFLVTWRWIRPSLAVPAALVSVIAFSTSPRAAVLVNPCTTFLAGTMTGAFLLITAVTGRTLPLAFAAIFAAIVGQTHTAALGYTAALLCIAVLACERRIRAPLIAAALYALAAVLTSPRALQRDFSGLREAGTFWPAIVIAFVLAAACYALNPWFRKRSRPLRMVAVGVLILGVSFSGEVWQFLVTREPRFPFLYSESFVGPAAVAGCAVVLLPIEWALRRWPRMHFVASLLAVLICGGIMMQEVHANVWAGWSYDDGRRAAERLNTEGWTFRRLYTRVQGRQCTDLRLSLIPYMARRSDQEVAPDTRRAARLFWRVGDTSSKPLPPGGVVLTSRGDYDLVFSEFDSWLDLENADFCVQPATGSKPAKCLPMVGTADVEPFSYAEWLTRLPAVAYLGEMSDDVQGRISLIIPLHPAKGEVRDLSFLEREIAPGCRLQIVAVEGVNADRPLPAERVRLSSPDGAPGYVIAAVDTRLKACQNAVDVCPFETTPGDPAWMSDPDLK